MNPKRSRAKSKRYPSDLTRTQWKTLKRLLPPAKPGGRPRSVDLREVLNGILYIVRGGCAWRMMPTDLPGCLAIRYSAATLPCWSSRPQTRKTLPRPRSV